MKDDLGKRMKEQYEMRTRTFLPRRTYTIIRLDGKAFHTFTRGMERPYDKKFMNMMDVTAKFLLNEIQGAKLAYVQSDEISLLLTDFDKITTNAWFDGQVQKMVSVSASLATAKFNKLILSNFIKDKFDCGITNVTYRYMENFEELSMAFFDARVFTIPDPVEVENYFIWRQKDAIRNSISMHAQSLYSHKELHGKSQEDMLKMIEEKGKRWEMNDLGFQYGRTFHTLQGKPEKSFSIFTDKMKVGTFGEPGCIEQRVITQFIPKISYE